jgi:hypothetical protein
MFVSVASGARKPDAPACRSKQWPGGAKTCRAQYQVILRRFWDEASFCLGTLPREVVVGSHNGVKCGGSGFADSRMLICMKRGIRNSTYRHLGPTQNPCWRQIPCRHGKARQGTAAKERHAAACRHNLSTEVPNSEHSMPSRARPLTTHRPGIHYASECRSDRHGFCWVGHSMIYSYLKYRTPPSHVLMLDSNR